MSATIYNLSEKPEFVETCAAWSYGQWGSQLTSVNLIDVLTDYKNRINKNDQATLPQTWVAFDNQSLLPIGMVTLKAEEPESSDEWSPWVARLFVHPTYRGQGIADALMQHLETKARELGYEALYLTTSSAEDYYRRKQNGWMEIERAKSPYIQGRYVPIMKKSL